ncbi:uncharacterized protein LOC120348769 [Nilaparvata lugens]|uniref:uncharacterized protein LOC120348769 n=1 Tax=Nilaparvata lugens TaxID=108931 RepID=UPI00193CACD9|nr:uncharacterized protein LOC120348769 [Nilaparvata lugens]
MQDYLSGHTQVVTLDGAKSEALQVNHGVPQGSILSPLLFLIFINDLSMNLKALLFADDITLVGQDEDPQLAILRSAQLLEEASSWFGANRLCMNQTNTLNILCILKCGPPCFGEPEVKLLGFMIDATLSRDQHINMICNRLSKVTYLMRKLRSIVPRNYLVTAYHALFHSNINFGIVLWGHAGCCERILLLQKKVIRIITFSPYLEHCRPLFKELWILAVFSQYLLSSDIGLHIREQLKLHFSASGELNPTICQEKCDRRFVSLKRLVDNHHKNVYRRSANSSATGLTAEQCNSVLSDEFLDHLAEQRKSVLIKVNK